MTTATTTPTAREVVARYLQRKAEHTKPVEQRELVATATREIVDELPDGFGVRDVRTCVGEYVAERTDLDGISASRIGRAVTKTLNDMVADGQLAIDGSGTYVHRGA